MLLDVSCAFSVGGGPACDHYDGWRFHQPEPLTIGFTDWLERTLSDSHRGAWRDYTDTPPGSRPPAHVDGGRLRVTFVGDNGESAEISPTASPIDLYQRIEALETLGARRF